MNDRNLYRATLLAAALFTAVQATSADAALPLIGVCSTSQNDGPGNYGAAVDANGRILDFATQFRLTQPRKEVT